MRSLGTGTGSVVEAKVNFPFSFVLKIIPDRVLQARGRIFQN